jgi:D-alanyl-D-alanine carboxypeptidase
MDRPTVTGIKTGYTSTAGNTYVATAERDGRALLGVILKSPSKTGIYTDMKKLFEYVLLTLKMSSISQKVRRSPTL